MPKQDWSVNHGCNPSHNRMRILRFNRLTDARTYARNLDREEHINRSGQIRRDVFDGPMTLLSDSKVVEEWTE